MKSSTDKERRRFIKLLASGGAAGALGSMGQLALMSEATAANPEFSGYKAMVAVFFLGGNDSFNMFIPSDVSSYATYKAGRGNLAIQRKDLGLASIANDIKNGTLGKGAANLYNVNGQQETAYTKGFYDLAASNGFPVGVNGLMPELAQLITDKQASVIANVGNLVSPVTRAQIKDKSADLPLFLFAHNHQQRALQTGQGDNLNDIGWAGKIADAWAGVNNSSPLGLNISYSGNNRMLIGDSTSPLVLKPGKVPFYRGMRKDHNLGEDDRRAIFKSLSGIASEASSSTLNFNNTAFTDSNPFKRLYGNMIDRSMTSFDTLSATLEENSINYSSKGPYGEDLFANVEAADIGFSQGLSGSFTRQLEGVAQMIDLGAKDAFNTGNYKRQIFFVTMGGFDTHNNQATRHSALLREISLGLWKFQTAMQELGHEKKVTTFSMSDFGRSISVNSGGGTDHAWGGHHFVMGGAGDRSAGNLNGGKMFGNLPDLTLDGPDDYSKKGRMIPSTAQDQINATICEWFGVDQSLISKIFPNVSNFETTPGNLSSAFLEDLFV